MHHHSIRFLPFFLFTFFFSQTACQIRAGFFLFIRKNIWLFRKFRVFALQSKTFSKATVRNVWSSKMCVKTVCICVIATVENGSAQMDCEVPCTYHVYTCWVHYCQLNYSRLVELANRLRFIYFHKESFAHFRAIRFNRLFSSSYFLNRFVCWFICLWHSVVLNVDASWINKSAEISQFQL